MSAISENIYKNISRKIVDILNAIVILFLAFYLMHKFGGTSPYTLLIIFVGMIAVFYLSQKGIDIMFDKWKVAVLDTTSKKFILILETTFDTSVMVVIVALLKVYMDFGLANLIIIFGLILLIRETIKWRRFKKEIKADVDNISKEVEEKTIEVVKEENEKGDVK